MKVKMLVDTAYRGPLVKGDETNVPEDVAKRWAKNRIAEIVEGMAGAEPEVVEEVNEAETEVEDKVEVVEIEEEAEADYGSMTAKELYALCTEKGIEVEPKQPKAYYIEKLA